MVNLLIPSAISLFSAISLPMVTAKHRVMPMVLMLLTLLISIILPSGEMYLLNLGYMQIKINDMPLLGQYFLIAYWIHLALITNIAYNSRDWSVIWLGLWQMFGITIALTAGNFTTIAVGIELVTLTSLVGLVLSENGKNNSTHQSARIYSLSQLPAGILIVAGAILVDQEIVVMPSWYGLMALEPTMTAELGHNLIILGLLLHLGAPPLTMVMPRCYRAASPLIRTVIAPTSSKLCLWVLAMTYSGVDWFLPCGLFIWAYGMIYACFSRHPEDIAVNYQLQTTGLIIAALSTPIIETNLTILALVAVQILLLTLVYSLLHFREQYLLKNRNSEEDDATTLRFGVRVPSHQNAPKISKVDGGPIGKLYKWQGRLLAIVWLVVIFNLLPIPGTTYYDLKHDILGYMPQSWLQYCWIIGNIAAVYYLSNLYHKFNQSSFYTQKLPRIVLALCGVIAFLLITPTIYRWIFSQFSAIQLVTETDVWSSVKTILVAIIAYKAIQHMPQLPTLKYDLLDLWKLARKLVMLAHRYIRTLLGHTPVFIPSLPKRMLLSFWNLTAGLEHTGIVPIRLLSLAMFGILLLIVGLIKL